MSTRKAPHPLPQSGGSYTVEKGKLKKQPTETSQPVKPAAEPEKES